MAKNKTDHYRNEYQRKDDKKEKLDECVAYIKDCKEKWDSHWATKKQKFEEYYDRWLGTPPKRDEDWQATFHKRLSWIAEKVLVARYHSALFPISAPIDTDATETTDELQAILGKSIVAHWFKIGLISKEFLSGMRSAFIYGTGVYEDDWYLKTEYQPEMVSEQVPDYRTMVDEQSQPILDDEGNVKNYKIGEKTVKKEQNKLKVVEDRYRLRKANIFSWTIHPDKLTDDDDYPVIKQEFINYQTLEKRQNDSVKMGFGGFENMKEIKDDVFKVDETDLKRIQKDSSGYDDDKNPRLELLHYWGYYNNPKDTDKDYKSDVPMWITIVNRKFKLQKRSNPFWHKKPPLFHIVWTEDEKSSYYGIGGCEIGGSAEDRANDNVNKRTDIKSKLVKGTGWYNANDKKIKKAQLKQNTPGTTRACSDINAAYRPDIVQPLGPDDYREEEVAVNDHREITGSTTALLPPANKNDQPDTLGGMQINLQQALSRLKPDLQMMEMMGIRKIANRAFLLTRQLFKQSKMIELMASEDKLKELGVEKMYQYTPESITGNVNFICIGLSESVEKSQNIDKAMKFIEVTGKIPVASQVINYPEILKDVAMWIGFQNSSKYILPTPMPQNVPQPGANPQGIPQGLPPGALPQGLPMPQPMMRPPMPMQRPPMPGMLPQGGNGNRLPPQILQMIIQQMLARKMVGQNLPQPMPPQ